MLILLWILILIAGILTVFTLLTPRDIAWIRSKLHIEDPAEGELKQLREQVESLVRQLQNWQDRERKLIEQLIPKNKSQAYHDKLDQLVSDNLQLREKIKGLLLFEKQNKDLSAKVFKLASDVKRLEEDNFKQKGIISKLYDREKSLLKDLEEIKKEETKLKKTLSDKNKVILEMEEESSKLQEKNRELADGLSYEINN
jgi:chromosome segregation ATPase